MIQTPSTVIENVEQLKEYLQVAIQLEHATIPPYLTAAYSAKIEANKPSIDIIRAVAKEEMLHLTQAANLLNAIDGQPDLISPDFVPPYPTHLPTGQDDFDVGIEKFSNHALKIFFAIERPTSLKPEDAEIVRHIKKTVPISGRHIDKCMLENENPLIPVAKVGDDKYELHYNIALVPHHHLTAKRKAISEAGDSLVPRVPAKSSAENRIELHYWSIGEFYKAIHLGFVELAHKMEMKALFTGDPKRQVDPKYYYSAGGELMVVTDLKSALAAIDLIAGQGEGSNHRVYDGEGELAHYYRFDQIQKKRYYRDPNKDGTGDKADHPQGGGFPVDMDSVFSIKTNAKVADYHGHPELEERALLFNGRYKRFLEKLNTAFNGYPELLGGRVFVEEMFRIERAMERLIHNKIPGRDENAAPTFEMDQFKYPPDAPT
jgi:rubrerythrin